MKKVKIFVRIVAWFSFIGGLALFISWAILERWPGFDIPIVGGMELETMSWLGAIMGLCGLIVAAIVEDNANWESICRWVGKRKG